MTEMTLDQALSVYEEGGEAAGDEALAKLVIFALGADWFAFYGDNVSEILARADVFFVPGCPASLEGVINVRGDIESVFRPHALLHASEANVSERSPILLGRGNGMKSGIRIDDVIDVVDIPRNVIEPPATTLPASTRQLILGVLRFGERVVSVLDLDKIFAAYAAELG